MAPHGEDDGVVGRQQDVDVDRRRRRAALARNSVPSASIWAQPPVEVALLHLELGDAVAQQAADAVGALEHEHVVAGAGQLLGGGEPGRARSR